MWKEVDWRFLEQQWLAAEIFEAQGHSNLAIYLSYLSTAHAGLR